MILLQNIIIKILLIPIFLFFSSGLNLITPSNSLHSKNNANSFYDNSCREQVQKNLNILTSFLSDPEWEQGRMESNTDDLQTSQIVLLTNPNYNSSCETFNTRYQEAISATYPDGSSENNISYYKAGNFYFVVISIHQPTDPDLISSGSDIIHIFDQNLNFVKGYFF